MTYFIRNEKYVDVFTGMGWDNHTVFEMKRVKGKVYLTKVSGPAIDDNEFKTLCEKLR